MAWTDEIVKPGLQVEANLRLEGIPYEFCTVVPTTWAVAGKTIFDGLDVPPAITSSVDPKEWKGHDGRMTFALTDLPDGVSTYRLSSIFAGTAMARLAATVWSTTLAADVVAGDTTLTFEHNVGIPALPFDIYFGHETASVDSVAAGPVTYNVTRALYPAAATFLTNHQTIPRPGLPGQLVASTQPTSWFNRVVVLYLTWRDENGNWGARADAKRRWAGRIKAVRFMGDDKWELDCAPISDDLDRQILYRPAQSEVRHGLDLRNWSTADLTYYVTGTDAAANPIPEASGSIAAQFYPEFNNVYQALEDGMGADFPPATWGRFSFGYNPGLSRVILHWFSAGGPTVEWVHLHLSPRLWDILGFAFEGPDPAVSFVAASVRDTYTPSFPPVAAMWDRASNFLRLNSTIGFTSIAMADGGNPAVRVGNRTILRYSSIAGDDLVLPEWLPDAGDSASDTWGETSWEIREGETVDPLVVSQVYWMPRAFGVDINRLLPLHLLRLMTSTGQGLNGAYDVLPDGYGIGIQWDLVDVASFGNLTMVSPASWERAWFIEKPTSLREIIDAETAVSSFVVVMDDSGQITARRILSEFPGASVVTLDEGNRADRNERSTWELSGGSVVNSVSVRYNLDPLEILRPLPLVIQDAISQDTYGELRGFDIEHRGLFNFTLNWVRDLIAPIVSARFVGHANPQVRIGRSISRDLFTRTIVGDIVLVTDAAAPNHETGERGFTDVPFRLLELSEDLSTGQGRVVLVRASEVPTERARPLCPSASVVSALGTTITLVANAFTTVASGEVDRDYFMVNDVVLFWSAAESDPLVPVATDYRTIASIGPGANQIVINAGLTPPTSPIFMTFSHHITDGVSPVAAAQQTRGTWIAAADDGLINNTASALPNVYTP